MCCKSFLKIMMFIFNGGIFLAGGIILAVGVWVKVDSNSFLSILENVDNASSGVSQLSNVTYLLIAVGALLLIIGFLGCCGAVKESKCMLLTFFSIVLIIFLIEVAGAVVLLVFQGLAEKLLKGLEKEVILDIQRQYGQKESLTSLWNSTMEQFKCCGFTNYTNFDGSPFLNGSFYPTTCCNNTLTDECTKKEAELSNIDGCFTKLVQLIEDNAVIIGAVALGVASLEIAAMVVSMVLYCQAGRKS